MNENRSLQVTSPKELLTYLQGSRSAIEMALPKHLNPDRMMRLALTCFSTNPALRNCDPRSILASIVVASQIGLEPGVAGQGYLIPYKSQCTFVPGWQGLVGLLNNTGRATAWTGAVFEGDSFDFQLGSAPRCTHIPGPNFGDPDKLTWVYACGKVNGSEQPVVEAWPIGRILKHRDRFNKVGDRHYSFAHPEMYARKVVLLQVLKYMPRSIELNNAITASDAAEIGKSVAVDGGIVVEVDASPDGPIPEPLRVPQAAPVPQPKKTASKPASPPRNEPADDPTESNQDDNAPASEAAPDGESATQPSMQDDLASTLLSAGVSFDDFRDWLETTGRIKDPEGVPSFREVPDSVCSLLLNDPKLLARCITIYGKKKT